MGYIHLSAWPFQWLFSMLFYKLVKFIKVKFMFHLSAKPLIIQHQYFTSLFLIFGRRLMSMANAMADSDRP